MKELSIEEKAKRYDEALKRAKEWFNPEEPDSYTCIVESIFPELKEKKSELIEKQGEQIDSSNKEYWRGYREGKKEILDKYTELEKQDELIKDDDEIIDNEDGLIADTIRYKNETQGKKKPIIEMKSPEESLGISSKEYNEIVNGCLYDESKPTDDVIKPKVS